MNPPDILHARGHTNDATIVVIAACGQELTVLGGQRHMYTYHNSCVNCPACNAILDRCEQAGLKVR